MQIMSGTQQPPLERKQFRVLRKCQGKLDCLVFEMLYTKNPKSNLNIQTDSIRAKMFGLVNDFHIFLTINF